MGNRLAVGRPPGHRVVEVDHRASWRAGMYADDDCAGERCRVAGEHGARIVLGDADVAERRIEQLPIEEIADHEVVRRARERRVRDRRRVGDLVVDRNEHPRVDATPVMSCSIVAIRRRSARGSRRRAWRAACRSTAMSAARAASRVSGDRRCCRRQRSRRGLRLSTAGRRGARAQRGRVANVPAGRSRPERCGARSHAGRAQAWSCSAARSSSRGRGRGGESANGGLAEMLDLVE